MGEERDANKIRKMKIQGMNFSALTYYILLVTGGVLKDETADCFQYRNSFHPCKYRYCSTSKIMITIYHHCNIKDSMT